MDTAGRLLRLLVLLSARAAWSADELVQRLEITDRTLRRDVVRLRDLGYPVASTTGPYGGYSLGAGGRLPPLLLDDDEAVAVAVGLRTLSTAADPTLGEPAVAALTKLGQVLPSGLRERVDTLGAVVVHTPWASADGSRTDVAVLLRLAQASRAGERLRFDYRRNDGATGRRHVEPHRLVSVRTRWYLVAFDLDRGDWRTFRVDRIAGPQATGARALPRPSPDAAALVAAGIAVGGYESVARVRLPVAPDEAARRVPPTVAVIETTDPASPTTVVAIGGDLDWIARYVAGLPWFVDVIEPPELETELQALAEALLRHHTRPRDGSLGTSRGLVASQLPQNCMGADS